MLALSFLPRQAGSIFRIRVMDARGGPSTRDADRVACQATCTGPDARACRLSCLSI